jgi:hypothetical protein
MEKKEKKEGKTRIPAHSMTITDYRLNWFMC